MTESRFRRVTREHVDSDLTSEKLMLTSAIISDDFCQMIRLKYNSDYIQNAFIKQTMDWCLAYFNEFGKAPKQDIEKVFEYKSSELDKSSKDLIEYLLYSLSQSLKSVGNTDHQLILKETRKYFQKRHVEIAMLKVKVLMDKKKIESAVQLLSQENFKEDLLSDGNLENIFERGAIESAWDRIDMSHVFSFTGAAEAMNYLTGFIKKGWLMAYLAPPKRGKTSWLIETACQAMVYGCKVLFVSLEMNSEAIRQRFYSRFLCKPADVTRDPRNFTVSPDGSVLARVPYIDCVHNRDDSCHRQERADYYAKSFLVGTDVNEHFPCMGCIRKPDCDFSMTIETIWERVEDETYAADHRKLLAIGRHIGRNLRLVTYPSYLGGIDDIEHDLEVAKIDGFIPNIIIVDYADILRPSSTFSDQRHNLDVTWKTLKGLAETSNSVLITASQTNRAAVDEKRLQQKHVAEDFRKLAHVDVFLALNQTNFEKDVGIKRVNVVAHRHKDFSPFVEVYVSEALHLGQVCVNSVIPPKKVKKDEEEDDDD